MPRIKYSIEPVYLRKLLPYFTTHKALAEALSISPSTISHAKIDGAGVSPSIEKNAQRLYVDIREGRLTVAGFPAPQPSPPVAAPPIQATADDNLDDLILVVVPPGKQATFSRLMDLIGAEVVPV